MKQKEKDIKVLIRVAKSMLSEVRKKKFKYKKQYKSSKSREKDKQNKNCQKGQIKEAKKIQNLKKWIVTKETFRSKITSIVIKE